MVDAVLKSSMGRFTSIAALSCSLQRPAGSFTYAIVSRACFKENLSLHIFAEQFLNDLFRILLKKCVIYLSQNF